MAFKLQVEGLVLRRNPILLHTRDEYQSERPPTGAARVGHGEEAARAGGQHRAQEQVGGETHLENTARDPGGLPGQLLPHLQERYPAGGVRDNVQLLLPRPAGRPPGLRRDRSGGAEGGGGTRTEWGWSIMGAPYCDRPQAGPVGFSRVVLKSP